MITYLTKVAVSELPEGRVAITRFSTNDMEKYGFSDEDKFIEFYMTTKRPGMSYTVLSDDVIPKDANGNWDRTNRKEWSLKSGKVQVDQAKVDAKNAEKAKKQAALAKLKITEDELRSLLRG